MNYMLPSKRQDGFVLIIAMILLVVLSLISIRGMSSASIGEKMSGSYRERSQAIAAAEQALLQGQVLLQANAVLCMDTVCDNTNLVGTAAATASANLPNAWSDTNSVSITTVVGQVSTGKYLINALTHANFSKVNCKPYSIMGRGQGANASSVAVLQTVAYVCPAD